MLLDKVKDIGNDVKEIEDKADGTIKKILYACIAGIVLVILCYFLCGRIEKLYNTIFTDTRTVDDIKRETDGIREEQRILSERVGEQVDKLRDSDTRVKERFEENGREITECKRIVGELLQRAQKEKP